MEWAGQFCLLAPKQCLKQYKDEKNIWVFNHYTLPNAANKSFRVPVSPLSKLKCMHPDLAHRRPETFNIVECDTDKCSPRMGVILPDLYWKMVSEQVVEATLNWLPDKKGLTFLTFLKNQLCFKSLFQCCNKVAKKKDNVFLHHVIAQCKQDHLCKYLIRA